MVKLEKLCWFWSKEILEEEGVEVFKKIWFKLVDKKFTYELAEKIASKCVLKIELKSIK